MIKKLFVIFISLCMAIELSAELIDWQYAMWSIVRDNYYAYTKDVSNIGIDTSWFNNVYAHRFRGSADSLDHLASYQFLRSDVSDTGKYLLLDSLTTKQDIRINGYDLFFGTRTSITSLSNALIFKQPGYAGTMHYQFFADSGEAQHRSQSVLMLIYGAGGKDTCLSLTHTGTYGEITTRSGDLSLDAATDIVKIGSAFLEGSSKLRGTTTFTANTTRRAVLVSGLTNMVYCIAGWRSDTTSANFTTLGGVGQDVSRIV